MSTQPLVVVVCTGNICRSPMAERIARARARERGLPVRITSAGVSSEEEGNPMDVRAERRLADHGYDVSPHTATRITDAEIAEASLIVAMTPHHRLALLARGADPDTTKLLTDFDADATTGSGVPDPWYGPDSAFDETLTIIESAMDGLIGYLESAHGE